MWWAENCVYEALGQMLKHNKKPVDEIQQNMDDLKYRVKSIKENAMHIGTNMHSLAEDYILGKEVITPTTEPLKTMFSKFKKFWDKKKIKVLETEKTYYSKELDVCGTIDTLVEYRKKIGILDFKTSKGEKKEDWIENYFIQGSAYAEMYEEHFNKPIEQVVILIVTEEGTTQIFKKNKNDYLPKLKDAIEKFYKWVETNERNI